LLLERPRSRPNPIVEVEQLLPDGIAVKAVWSRLRLILFYIRDSTIVWDDGQVIARRVFEPCGR